MFCSKCGKTLKLEDASCPYCGAQVGDSRFEGNGYTSAQPRFVSITQTREERDAAAYTRTTYTSMDEGEQEGDIYSRTTYRPLFKEEEEAKKPEPEPAEDVAAKDESQQESGPVTEDRPDEEPAERVTRAERAGREPGVRQEPVRQAHKRPAPHVKESAPNEDDDPDKIVIAPPKPIKKTGISPEVQQYMERMNEQQHKTKKRRSFKSLLGTDEADTAAADAVETGAEGSPEHDPLGVIEPDGAEAVEVLRKQSHRRVPGWIKPAAIIVCVAVILTVAAYALILRFADSSPLEGVGYDLHASGIQLIQGRQSEAYRTELVKLVQTDPSMQELSKRLQEDHAEIQALMPQNPLPNDELFIKTLDAIQDTVDSAVMAEALAVLNANDAQLTRLSEQAMEAWEEVNNSIVKLVNAKVPLELEGIIDDTVLALTTPTPEPTPEPDQYKTLKRSTTKDKNVEKLQRRLKQLGWFVGTVDAYFGMNTYQAVKKFQEAAGITPVDGIADNKTQIALYAEDAPRAGAAGTPKPTASPAPSGDATVQTTEPEADEPVVTDVPK